MEALNASKNVHECTFYSALAGEFQKIAPLKISQRAKSIFFKFASSNTIQRSNTSIIIN
jgi:hypothetical protein